MAQESGAVSPRKTSENGEARIPTKKKWWSAQRVAAFVIGGLAVTWGGKTLAEWAFVQHPQEGYSEDDAGLAGAAGGFGLFTLIFYLSLGSRKKIEEEPSEKQTTDRVKVVDEESKVSKGSAEKTAPAGKSVQAASDTVEQESTGGASTSANIPKDAKRVGPVEKAAPSSPSPQAQEGTPRRNPRAADLEAADTLPKVDSALVGGYNAGDSDDDE